MKDIDSPLYRGISGFAHETPAWVQHLAEAWTEAGLLLFAVLFAAAWWRARRGGPDALALAVLAPLATAVAYVCSELVKSAVDEERPCRAVAGAPASLIPCPPHGDWSFPSNHATIAGAAAVALALAWRGTAPLAFPMALLMAYSRVFVGVHYPHDVLVGLLIGAIAAYAVVRLGGRPMTRVAEALRTASAGSVRWFAGPGCSVSGSGRSQPQTAGRG